MGPDADTEVTVDTVLVTVDGSDAAAEATEYATAIAAKYGADLHALYVVDEHLTGALDAGAADPEAATTETQRFLDGVRDLAEEYGVSTNASTAYAFSTARKSVHPGSVILDAAEELDVDFVVVPRETGAGPVAVLEKAAEYVLQYASQPTLSV